MRNKLADLIRREDNKILFHFCTHRNKCINRFHKIISEQRISGTLLMRYDVICNTDNLCKLVSTNDAQDATQAGTHKGYPETHHHQVWPSLFNLLSNKQPIDWIDRIDL